MPVRLRPLTPASHAIATAHAGVGAPGYNLQCQTLLLRSRRGRGDAGEFFYQLVELGDVVIYVFVAVLRIEIARQFGGFISSDFFRCRPNVITDLIAGPVIPAARQGELVGGSAVSG